jgi:hypothetical protein
MYSRKAIETAIHFSAGESERWSLNGLQFRADGSIEATDGHKAIVIPPQFERSECPKPYEKTRADVFVPRDTLVEMLRRTKGKSKGSADKTWYGVSVLARAKTGEERLGQPVTEARCVFFSWGGAVERMEFSHEAKFPDLHRVTDNLGDLVLTISLGAEAVIGLMQAMKVWSDTHRDGACATFEFHGSDKPTIFRAGGAFGAIMPYRADAEPGEFEKEFRGLDKPAEPGQAEPEQEVEAA